MIFAQLLFKKRLWRAQTTAIMVELSVCGTWSGLPRELASEL
jgi:hypothetical protein